ncbi:SDR family oxidoreductase [Streptomyces diastatochromogenes]|nr:SDR family oxidoreductase [Streptomyces diastatochromogenes]
MSRTCLVTGAASGIGEATTALLRARGHTVIAADLTDGDIRADLSTPEGRAALVARTRELTGGRLDAVVSCAGVARFDPLTIRVNHFGAVATLDGLRPLSRPAPTRGPWSSAPSTPSTRRTPRSWTPRSPGTRRRRWPPPGRPSTVARAPRLLLVEGVGLPLGPPRRPHRRVGGAGVPLNAVAPGVVVTPLTRPMLDDPEMRGLVDKSVPMPLHGHARPEQIAPLIAWLASPENTVVTGQVVFADGGADAVLRGDRTW